MLFKEEDWHAKGQEDEEISSRAKISCTVRNFAQAANFAQAEFRALCEISRKRQISRTGSPLCIIPFYSTLPRIKLTYRINKVGN